MKTRQEGEGKQEGEGGQGGGCLHIWVRVKVRVREPVWFVSQLVSGLRGAGVDDNGGAERFKGLQERERERGREREAGL